ncbi:MAG: hypothetical protein E7813_12015 [Bradyrhizobium sp.]|uniref:pantoate--beta-alanine ligase n=1 Tax=Bradyrhizobium sp. TaxID=376 RepID=UPI001205516B|nr:MAG: hypothetical protein E7813_12015 [Bradyrhizobium sp.]
MGSSPDVARPLIVRMIPASRRALDGFRIKKAPPPWVPTMAALHDGHVSLVRPATRRAARVMLLR